MKLRSQNSNKNLINKKNNSPNNKIKWKKKKILTPKMKIEYKLCRNKLIDRINNNICNKATDLLDIEEGRP